MILMKIVLVSSGSSLSHFLPRYTTVLKPVPKTVTKIYSQLGFEVWGAPGGMKPGLVRNEGCLKRDTREVAPDADEPILCWPNCPGCPDIVCWFGSSIPGRTLAGNLCVCCECCEILDIQKKCFEIMLKNILKIIWKIIRKISMASKVSERFWMQH